MKIKLTIVVLISILGVNAQSGHLMQGVGAVNMSMGGAATAQPLDISGALYWNPAAIAAFNKKTLSFNAGLFMAKPELFSKVPTGPTTSMSGNTVDVKKNSILPALSYVAGKANSKHTFGVSAFGISGFGVDFPESASNPINMPQSMGGFGNIASNYSLLQTTFTYAYKISKSVSIGIAPNFNYATLKLKPNPTANPNASGYPSTNNASATGVGAQIGIFYQDNSGFKLGASYKTEQQFSDFEFKNTHLNNATAVNAFKMNFPAILSVGVGYSNATIDMALDVRQVAYEKTAGFDASGWSSTAAVKGFGWKDMQIISTGLQYKGIKKLPLRFGYTYNTNPIKPELAFFSTPATAITQNAVQIGFSHNLSSNLTLDGVFHYGSSSGSTGGSMYSPMAITPTNPLGAIPGSEVSYKMKTSMIMFGINYKL
jgi:long-chain fatty acid transport protein